MKNSRVANMQLPLDSCEDFFARLLAEETILALLEWIFLKQLLPIVSQTEVFEELILLLKDLDFVVLFALETLH